MLHIRSQLAKERSESGVWEGVKSRSGSHMGTLSRRFIVLLAVAFLMLFLEGCEECDCDPVGDQVVYFEYHYINHAWGFQERGWLIDRYGYVRAFEFPQDYRHPDSTGMMTLQDLQYNLAQTDTTLVIVDPEELETYVSYIPAAAKGEIGKRTNIAADAGSSVLSCYLYDPEKDAYQYVLLGESGDWEQLNLSNEAGILVEWLLEFGVFWLSE